MATKTKKGYLNQFPEHWKVYRMDEILDRIKNKVEVKKEESYKQIGIRSHGKGIFYKEKVTGEELGNKSVFWIEPDCFIVNIVFAWEMAVAKTTKDEVDFIASHRFPQYKPKSDLLDLDFLLYYFKTPLGKHLLGLASPGGAGRNKTLGQNNFAELKICIPPINEQKRIAKINNVWDKGIEKSKKLEELLMIRKKGLLQLLLTGEMRLEGFDDKWDNLYLSNYLDVSKTINGDLLFERNDVLSVSKVFGIVNQIDLHGRSFAGKSLEKYGIVEQGDIVYTKSPLKLTPFGIFKVNNGRSGVVSTLYAVYKCKPNVIGEYIDYFFQLDDNVNRYLRPLVHKGSKNDMKINNNKVLAGKVSFPSKIEQEKIVNFFNKVDVQINVQKTYSVKLQTQKKGLMSQIFTGEIKTTF